MVKDKFKNTLLVKRIYHAMETKIEIRNLWEVIMTEREKMLAGQLYDCGDAELLMQWHKAKDLVRNYNQTDSVDAAGKEKILNELLGGKGKNLWITAPFYVDYGNNIFLCIHQ